MSEGKNIADELVTLFTTCKQFKGETAIFQENAIATWRDKFSNIILFGNDCGSAEIAEKYNLIHVPEIMVDEDGLPFINSMFSMAQQIATTPYLAYINSDILLAKDFQNIIQSAIGKAQDPLLVVARRKNIPITFSTLSDEGKDLLDEVIHSYATWDRANAIDLFLFSKALYLDIPAFVIGRMTWDNWLLWKARDEGAQVLDISLDACLYHPIHGYSSAKADRAKVAFGKSAQQNKQLAAGKGLNIEQAATHYLEAGGLFSTEADKQYVSQKCVVDLEKEFLSGLKYLSDGIHNRPYRETIDCLKTILFRHNQFVPLGADIENRNDFAELAGFLSKASGDVAISLEDWIAKPYISKVKKVQEMGKPIYIWGSGEYAKRLHALFRRHSVEISGIFDSNLELVGNNFCGIKISDYKAVVGQNKEKNLFILIASMYFIEIGTLLAELSLTPDADFIA